MKAQYFQTIESIFLESTGRGLVISESDRYCIERWFSAGIPLDLVGRAVAASCSKRDTPVRSLSLADREVEKYFKVWKSRQVGADRTVTGSYVDGFDVWLKGFESIKTTGRAAVLDRPIEQTVDLLRTLRTGTTDAGLLQAGLKRAELFFCDAIWDTCELRLKEELTMSVNQVLKEQGLTRSERHDELCVRMRNKKLRAQFELPVFEISLDGGW